MSIGVQHSTPIGGQSCEPFDRQAPHGFLCSRSLVLPNEVAQWSLTTLRERPGKIGARIVRHSRYLVFQLAEIAVPRALFAAILRRIDRLRGPSMTA